MKKFIFYTILITLLVIPHKVNAYVTPISDIYTQGIYPLDTFYGYNVSIELKDEPDTSILILDDDGKLTVFAKLVPNEKIYLNNINYKGNILIVGNGKVAVLFDKR
ncbi:hypothetical protein [Clostridium sp. LP20]|uniref:hypothetical protein n=1 Tax=Clostridium sp. LP20 TaxID=3418665 RepID=UPI003EE6FBB9